MEGEAIQAINNVQLEVEVEVSKSEPIIEETEEVPEHLNKDCQCDLIGNYSVEKFINNPRAILYYTGFRNYLHFMLFFQILGPAVSELLYRCTSLSPKDQLFLTLMKLRQAKDDIELSLSLIHI